ncbi:Oidioi.mRNA.OKI2018_I69.PAR.g10216.t1.cds [Oikopleura dioica]|uniref:peptidylprolyl isomerase n=1 Tax=Oikopleura dioica TaxID=34765 RepID=A0ABN7RUR5_OIKDI|nr:Oidioi.mRNA.OKI2018_I69.PAR.g10216.t1.cds [Oikopleura dioica]
MVDRKYSAEELVSDGVSKKDIVNELHAHGAEAFLLEMKVLGSVKNVAKKPKEDLIKAYEKMYEDGAFKGSEADVELVKQVATVKVTEEKKDDGPPKFKKRIIKKSPNKDARRPNKGEKIGCYYIGRLDGPDGKIFDQLQPQRRGSQTLNFKVGTGRVIRGWDEALLTMQTGEVAGVTIEPEWAYGKKGQPEAGIGPNQTLYFEITLDRIG